MTQEMQDKIKAIAVYDGWIIKGNSVFLYDENAEFVKGEHGCKFDDNCMLPNYHTSYDALMPVAKKARKDFSRIYRENSNLRSDILLPSGILSNAGSNFDMPEIFEATYNAILFINKNTDK